MASDSCIQYQTVEKVFEQHRQGLCFSGQVWLKSFCHMTAVILLWPGQLAPCNLKSKVPIHQMMYDISTFYFRYSEQMS